MPTEKIYAEQDKTKTAPEHIPDDPKFVEAERLKRAKEFTDQVAKETPVGKKAKDYGEAYKKRMKEAGVD